MLLSRNFFLIPTYNFETNINLHWTSPFQAVVITLMPTYKRQMTPKNNLIATLHVLDKCCVTFRINFTPKKHIFTHFHVFAPMVWRVLRSNNLFTQGYSPKLILLILNVKMTGVQYLKYSILRNLGSNEKVRLNRQTNGQTDGHGDSMTEWKFLLSLDKDNVQMVLIPPTPLFTF